MKKLTSIVTTLTAVGVAVKVMRKKCLICEKKATLEFKKGKFICQNCAQIIQRTTR